MPTNSSLTVLKKLTLISLATAFSFTGLSEEKKRDQKKISEGRERVKSQKKGYTKTRGYVHNWLKFPTITGTSVNGENITYRPQGGTPLIAIFLASWCVPCQKILPTLKKLEKKHQGKISFLYIFSHDIKREAQAFSKAYKISATVLATHSILKAFHNPQLPTIYISDRDGWLLERYLEVKESDIKRLSETLSLLDVY